MMKHRETMVFGKSFALAQYRGLCGVKTSPFWEQCQPHLVKQGWKVKEVRITRKWEGLMREKGKCEDTSTIV